ncbi:MAG: AAA family ATPase [Planctomycetota bacterium]|jgi:type II secretory pathway predicted ATPase ExeA|nr:AAA family ATPase [Planctomycetota bacterium]
MYEEYWRLADKPFRNTPDPHYLFFSRQYEEALARALYVVTEGQGAMLLTGDCGCGKTLLTRVMLDELDPARFEAALVAYPNLQPTELLGEILGQFGFRNISGWSKVRMLDTLGEFLRHTSRRGASTLVIVDEGQTIHSGETLEEVRLLLNFQRDRSFSLSLVLVGQPELRERVAALPQFAQRLAFQCHLSGLSPDESRDYLRHRLAVAGGSEGIFTRGAEDVIIENAAGVPRRLNYLADFSLLAGFGKSAPLVDAEAAREAADDLGW